MQFEGTEQWAAVLTPRWNAAPEQGKTDLRTAPDSDKDKDELIFSDPVSFYLLAPQVP
jgi:hypothetical protein